MCKFPQHSNTPNFPNFNPLTIGKVLVFDTAFVLHVALADLASVDAAKPADAPSGEVTNQRGSKRRKTKSGDEANEAEKQKKEKILLK